jgi:hypothetical protein
MKVQTLKTQHVDTLGIASRINEFTGKIQYHAGEILKTAQK